VVRKLGFAVQVAGIAIALLILFVMWKLSPEPGTRAGVSMGPEAPRRVLFLAIALVAAGLASLRWRWAELVLLIVAAVVAWHGLTNHFLLTSRAMFLPVSNGALFITAAVVAMVGLAIRAAAARPDSARRVLPYAAVTLVFVAFWIAVFWPSIALAWTNR
jgi:hypothetical protein